MRVFGRMMRCGVSSFPVLLGLCLLYVSSSMAQGYERNSQEEDKYQNALRLLEQLVETRKGLSALRGVIKGIDQDLLDTQKVKDLARKRKGLEVMNKLVDQMDGDLVTEQKRTCAFNLGGHCATESAASLADQWHYLNSPLSPGRKRRDTKMYQRLIKGKIFQ